MRITLFFIVLALFSLSGSYAIEQKCNFCSDVDAEFYADNLSRQTFPLSFIEADEYIFVASDTKINMDNKIPSVRDDKELRALPNNSANFDSLMDLIKDTDDSLAYRKEKFDILENFRNGDDVVVPLGFLLYINKKF